MVNEKQKIEKTVGEEFLILYNKFYNTDFCLSELSDKPDIICNDSSGNNLNLEITLIGDNKKDIQSLLGRSDCKNIENIKNNKVSCLSSDDDLNNLGKKYNNIFLSSPLVSLKERLDDKFNKDYGSNVALVIKDTSPLCWDWNSCRENILEYIKNKNNPFDKGIFIISNNKLFIIN